MLRSTKKMISFSKKTTKIRTNAVKNAAIIAITTIVVSLIVANLKQLHSAWTLLY